MATSKVKRLSNKTNVPTATTSAENTIFQLKINTKLWYKIQAMVFDMHNMQKSPSSWTRIDNTNDPQYLGLPYFTEDETTIIKATLIPIASQQTFKELIDQPANVDNQEVPNYQTIQNAIQETFQDFHRKREVSCDFKPCGPHDLAPAYLRIFDIKESELSKERFSDRRLKELGIGSVKDEKGTHT
jgi:hypothetical protein